jgi:hypothetical protein
MGKLRWITHEGVPSRRAPGYLCAAVDSRKPPSGPEIAALARWDSHRIAGAVPCGRQEAPPSPGYRLPSSTSSGARTMKAVVYLQNSFCDRHLSGIEMEARALAAR